MHAARKVRDTWPEHPPTFPPKPLHGKRFEQATEAAELLESYGLDGRDIDAKGEGLRRVNALKAPLALVRIALFIALFPFFLTSLGLQILLGRLLGDSTDEGLDARTSYQFLAAFFGSLLVWPVIAALWTGGLWWKQASIGSWLGISSTWIEELTGSALPSLVVIYASCFVVFWASGKSFAGAWDVWVDLRKAWRRKTMNRQAKERLSSLFSSLKAD